MIGQDERKIMQNLVLGLGGILAGALISNTEEKESRPLTIVKVGDHLYHPTVGDIDKWRRIFEGEMEFEDFPEGKNQHVSVETIDLSHKTNERSVVLVKVGSETHIPTEAELNEWRDIFEKAQYDPDFKIFTHPHVNIEVLNFGPGDVLVDRS